MDSKVSRSDVMLTVARSTIGMVPLVGPVIVEALATTLPNQRIDRVERLVHRLAEKIDEDLYEALRVKLEDSLFLALFEEVILQASRAATEERLEYLASFLATSLGDKEKDYQHSSHILKLLGEINDVQVLILTSESSERQRDKDFLANHGETVRGPLAHLGSPEDEVDLTAIYKSYRNDLVRLGLLKVRFAKPSHGKQPEFDLDTGTVKSLGYELTGVGRLLLRRVGLIDRW